MNKLRRIFLAFSVSLFSVFSFAQANGATHEESADFMRSSGKIYVVIAVVVVIVIGLFLYLVNLDRKITRLEKNKH